MTCAENPIERSDRQVPARTDHDTGDRRPGGAAADPGIAASCRGTSCRGLDPDSAGCTASSTPREKFIRPDAYVQLRYSSVCSAYWARFRKDLFDCCRWVTLQEEQHKLIGGVWEPWYFQDKAIVIEPTTGVWTTMNPNEANDRHRACIVEYNWCTGWI